MGVPRHEECLMRGIVFSPPYSRNGLSPVSCHVSLWTPLTWGECRAIQLSESMHAYMSVVNPREYPRGRPPTPEGEEVLANLL